MADLTKKIIPLILSQLKRKRSWALLLSLAGSVAAAIGVSNSTLDRFWTEPRDLLVDRVVAARDAQHDAAEEFADALTEFKAVVDLPESGLEKRYRRLSSAFERSEEAAGDISRRVDRVVNASNRLLSEWKDELSDYHDERLKGLAEQQFDKTRLHAERLIAAMRASEADMEPVLAAFRDQVLYLKHNLNLSAISSLEGEARVIETDVEALIAEMNRSIAEADAFLKTMAEAG